MTNFPTRKLQSVQTTPPAKPPSQILPRFRCISASVSGCSINGAVYTCVSAKAPMKTAEDVEEPPGRRCCLGYSRPIMRFTPALLVILFSCGGAAVSRAADFEYIRRGNPQDVETRAEAGVAMMG